METACDGDRYREVQGGGKDVFVHISAVERAGLSTLNESQQVQYEEVANKGKTTAENHVGEVNRMSGAPGAPPWGWLVSSPDQKPNDLDAILRDTGGLQGTCGGARPRRSERI